MLILAMLVGLLAALRAIQAYRTDIAGVALRA